jgi:hypothetical protein
MTATKECRGPDIDRPFSRTDRKILIDGLLITPPFDTVQYRVHLTNEKEKGLFFLNLLSFSPPCEINAISSFFLWSKFQVASVKGWIKNLNQDFHARSRTQGTRRGNERKKACYASARTTWVTKRGNGS